MLLIKPIKQKHMSKTQIQVRHVYSQVLDYLALIDNLVLSYRISKVAVFGSILYNRKSGIQIKSFADSNKKRDGKRQDTPAAHSLVRHSLAGRYPDADNRR